MIPSPDITWSEICMEYHDSVYCGCRWEQRGSSFPSSHTLFLRDLDSSKARIHGYEEERNFRVKTFNVESLRRTENHCFIIYTYLCGWAVHDAYIEIRGQLSGIDSLLPSSMLGKVSCFCHGPRTPGLLTCKLGWSVSVSHLTLGMLGLQSYAIPLGAL